MRTILLGLNELNFDYIRFYADKGLLPNFKSILTNHKVVETVSEDKYELLEPWIQWATLHTGKTFEEHQIFRLGDVVNSNIDQLFESIESHGFSVGAVSPFNAKNVLKNPAFFIPDPWTMTKVSGNWFIKSLYKAIHQSVNDNASGKLNITSLLILLIGVLRVVPIRRYPDLVVHRCIKQIIHNKKLKSLSKNDLADIAENCSFREREADQISKEADKVLRSRCGQNYIGNKFSGIITGVTEFGVFVKLDQINIEGLCHISSFKNKYYNFNYEMKSLVSRQGTISIGDKMSCIIESVHPYEGKISLIPA